MPAVLALDGGGVFGLILARTLAKLHPGESGHQILSHYRLAVGTSAGGIVLAALVADMMPDAIASLFLDPETRASLFVRDTQVVDRVAAAFGIGPKWSTAAKIHGIRDILDIAGHRPLSASPIPVAMVAFDVDRQRDVVLASYNENSDVPLALAAHATSNPPVIYFDEPVVVKGMRLWDGGVAGLTNPAMVAVCEAYTLGITDVRVLSLGTGTVERPVGPNPLLDRPRANTSILGTIPIMARSIMGDPPVFSSWAAYAATDGKCVRLSPVLAPDSANGMPTVYLTLGGSEAFEALAVADLDCQDQATIELIDRWCQEWLEGNVLNQLVRLDEARDRIYGHLTATAALAQWRLMCA